MSTVDHHNEELLKEVEAVMLDAEFKVLTESNEQTAITQSGLAILFDNWSKQH